MDKTVIVTGVLGQDGYYMARYILENHPEYTVIGLAHAHDKRVSLSLDGLDKYPKFKLNYTEFRSPNALSLYISSYRPDMVFNFAGLSNPRGSWENTTDYFKINTLSVSDALESIKNSSPKTKFFSSGSSLELGLITSYNPLSPYALSKASAGMFVKMYREKFGLYCVHGTLFNHTSPRSSNDFLVKKLVNGAADIFSSIKKLEDATPIETTGNLNSMIDWSDSRDIVVGAWKSLQQNRPSDYHFGSGSTMNGYSLIEMVFSISGIPFKWEDDGLYLPDAMKKLPFLSTGKLLSVNRSKQTPTPELQPLCNTTATENILGWKTEIPFDMTIRNMVEYAHYEKCRQTPK